MAYMLAKIYKHPSIYAQWWYGDCQMDFVIKFLKIKFKPKVEIERKTAMYLSFRFWNPWEVAKGPQMASLPL